LHSIGLGAATQARIISGLRVFFEYLVQEKICGENPLELIDSPRLIRPIPDVLSPEEMIQLLDSVDLSRKEGVRNRAILELMYSCGLRVSELTDFKISCIHAQDSFVRIIGKGNKERLVPIGKTALDWMERYQREMRNHQDIAHGHEDFLFLNLRGKKLSRMSIFNFIQEVSRLAGISKHISPHGFRHAFATHLVEAGADLRAVQEMLGHASITTTEIYTHLDRNRLRDEILTYHPAYYRKS
jgi:integrase/recombinase XerD